MTTWPRSSDSRYPTLHAATHAADGIDPITVTGSAATPPLEVLDGEAFDVPVGQTLYRRAPLIRAGGRITIPAGAAFVKV